MIWFRKPSFGDICEARRNNSWHLIKISSMAKTNLFQILISNEAQHDLPPSLKKSSEGLVSRFPHCEYSLWDNDRIANFLQKEYEPNVFKAYKSLIPFAYKSDLARYCLLHHFGGWYFDLGIQLAKPKVVLPLADEINMIFFWDIGESFSPARSFYDCMNGIIYSKPLNPVLRIAINLVIENCCSKFYGSDSMSPTGPGVLGRAIAIHGKNQSLYDGQFRQLTPNHAQSNKAYILQDGTIFAWHRSHFIDDPQENDLSYFGLKGGNDYRILWRDRKVYAE